MGHDLQLRAAARAIYDACYPSEEWTPCGFDEAERYGTIFDVLPVFSSRLSESFPAL